MATECTDRTHDSTEIARIGHAIKGNQQWHTRRECAVEQLVWVQVIKRRHLQDESLMHRTLRVTIEFHPLRVEQRNAQLVRQLDGLAHSLIELDAVRDVQRTRRNAGAQCLDNGVAASDNLGRIRVRSGRSSRTASGGRPSARDRSTG